METAELLLPESWDIPWKDARIAVPPGLVVVEMLPLPEKKGLLYLPEKFSQSHRPDVGVVIGVGRGTSLTPGDLVIVRPEDGHWQEGADLGGYKPKNQIRTYGKDYNFHAEAERFPWEDSIPLTYNGGIMQATANNVLIRRDPVVEKDCGLHLTETQKYRSCEATIVSLGPWAFRNKFDPNEPMPVKVSVGDRVNYAPRGVLEFAFKDDPDLALVRDLDINFVIHGEQTA